MLLGVTNEAAPFERLQQAHDGRLRDAGLVVKIVNGRNRTLVERSSRYVMLIKVANKDTESVVSALIKQSQKLPGELYQSLTWDRGKELADHQRLAMATDIEVYFCDPRSAWQRGSNENTNRLSICSCWPLPCSRRLLQHMR